MPPLGLRSLVHLHRDIHVLIRAEPAAVKLHTEYPDPVAIATTGHGVGSKDLVRLLLHHFPQRVLTIQDQAAPQHHHFILKQIAGIEFLLVVDSLKVRSDIHKVFLSYLNPQNYTTLFQKS